MKSVSGFMGGEGVLGSRTPRGLAPNSISLVHSSSLRSGELMTGNIRLSHPSHGVLEPFEFTFEIKIFYLVSIQMRIKKFCGINLRAAAVTHHSVISDVMKVNARMI
jgi:hypothetical protein